MPSTPTVDRLRFAVSRHDHPFLHWDVFLEHGAAARTWRLLEEPPGTGAVIAQPLNDHRLLYLDYAGPVSNGRGTVTPWDRGHYSIEAWDEHRVAVLLTGSCWQGRLVLTAGLEHWTARFER